MPEVVSLTIYRFEELECKVQSEVLERVAQNSWDDADSQELTFIFEERLYDLNLPNQKLEWRISYSQGDGLAFFGQIDELPIVLKRILSEADYKTYEEWRERGLNVHLNIRPSYSRRGYMMFVDADIDSCVVGDLDDETYDAWQGDYADFVNEVIAPKVEKYVRNVAQELFRTGQEEIEYRSSEEYLREMIEDREMRFLENGTVWWGLTPPFFFTPIIHY